MTNPQDLETIDITPSPSTPTNRCSASTVASRDSDRYAWASHFLQDMSKAIIDDVAKVLDAPCKQRDVNEKAPPFSQRAGLF